jgi:hypothetical protein
MPTEGPGGTVRRSQQDKVWSVRPASSHGFAPRDLSAPAREHECPNCCDAFFGAQTNRWQLPKTGPPEPTAANRLFRICSGPRLRAIDPMRSHLVTGAVEPAGIFRPLATCCRARVTTCRAFASPSRRTFAMSRYGSSNASRRMYAARSVGDSFFSNTKTPTPAPRLVPLRP